MIILILLLSADALGSVVGEGLVVTKTDSIYGEVKIDLANNRVNIKGYDNRHHSLLASQIERIIIGRGPQQKTYASAVFGADSDVHLFEILSEGKLSLFYRDGVKFSRFDQDTFPPYFVRVGNSLYSIGGKKEFFEVFGDEGKAMRDYVKEKGLQYGDFDDMVTIFNHFNGVEGSEIFAFND